MQKRSSFRWVVIGLSVWGLGLGLCGCKKETEKPKNPAQSTGSQETGTGKELKDTGQGKTPDKTLNDLQTAYNGEANARVRYEAFAKKADEEGFHQVASLFRAASKSEGVHVRNHAAVIRSMGASPGAEVKKPEVKSTRENLQTAIKGENYERLTMYPDFIKQAEIEKKPAAIRTFKYSQAAETMHARYFKDALTNLDKWKTGTKDFLVCSNCGYTTTDLTIKKCPVCGFPRSKINLVK